MIAVAVLEAAKVLAEAARELLCLTDDEGRVLAAAGPWDEAVGTPVDALAGTVLDDLVAPPDRAALRAYRAAALLGVPHDAVEVRLAGPGELDFDVVLRRVDDRVVASLRDVTEQRRAERQLQRLNDELQRSNDELQRFAYVASHDLSEPLRMVTSYCALLRDHCGDGLDDTAREYLDFAVDGALRMRALIDDLLAYSRVSWSIEEAERVELDEVFAGAVRDLGSVIAGSGADVVVEPLPAVMGNAGRLGQLATNLLGNAVKFRTPGAPPRIAVGASVEGAQVTLSVADNGIGVPERHRERIFVMFKRLHGRGAYEGNGIGLALCKRIAELHGGTVWVEAGPEGGSVFRVTLPAATR